MVGYEYNSSAKNLNLWIQMCVRLGGMCGVVQDGVLGHGGGGE